VKIRGIVTSAAAVVITVSAVAFVAPAAASAATGNLPRAAFSKSLHAEFEALRGHVTTGPRAGIVPPLGTHVAAVAATCKEPNCDLQYNGGAVQHSPHVYVDFWGPGWGNDQAQQAVLSYLLKFYKGLGATGDTWSLITSQYPDNSGHPVFGKSVFAEYGTDASAPPSEVTPDDLAAEAAAAASAFGIKDIGDAQVIVAAQSGTCFSDGFAGSSCTPVMASYCAWHSSTSFGSGELPFTNLPYQLDADGECGENFVNSGTAGTDDGFSIVGGHEYAESVTDPVPDNGYIDFADNVSGGEIADKCAWAGEIWGTPDPIGDIKLSTGTFAVQSLWSNVKHGCVMSGVSITPLGNQTSVLGRAVSLQVHGSAVPGVTLGYTATGLPTGLSINPATGLIHGTVSGAVKAYAAKVTVSYSTGPASFMFKWTVDAVGRVTGTWSKCVDNANGKITGGNKIDIATCTGKAQQTITFTPGGQLQLQGGCITGTTRALFEPCNSATNRIWTRTGSEYVNKSNGKCLTDPNNSKANGTALTLATCANRVYQHWSLP
jgi:Ricin-type beta-trefoil lectin domain/Putative Ig domain